ncbi:hypothetical protein L596_012839 [Steinernema carpocapsae]|uniref:Uncharacterized protein n=1 Tax=Steinernema carpocapsae TaxID=34508 RepID=A0A4U5NYX4_STECR|nr:hypothetical protein L596_012839 [Steinernema carpocapsae]
MPVSAKQNLLVTTTAANVTGLGSFPKPKRPSQTSSTASRIQTTRFQDPPYCFRRRTSDPDKHFFAPRSAAVFGPAANDTRSL